MAKRAVVVGINELSDRTFPPLEGCENDARAVAGALEQRFGFSSADIKLITGARATKDGVLRAVDWLVMTAAPGDQLVLYLATYGSHLPNERNDPRDGLDQVFLVHDHHWHMTVLRDDELIARFRRLPRGAVVTCIFDVGLSGAIERPAGAPMFGGPALTRGRYAQPPTDIPALVTARAQSWPLRPRFFFRRPDDAPVVAIAACGEDDVVAEIHGPNGMCGAFTASLVETLVSGAAGSWDQAAEQTRQRMHGKGAPATPQVFVPPELASAPPLGAPAQGGAAAGTLPSAPYGAPASAAGASAPGMLSSGYMPPTTPSPGGGVSAGMLAAGVGAAALGGLAVAGLASRGGGGAPATTPGAPLSSAVAAPSLPLPPQPASLNAVNLALREFSADDYSVKLSNAVCAVVPFAPKPLVYASVEEATPILYPQATEATLARARALAESPDIQGALKVLSAIDTGDAGIAAFSGLKSAWGLLRGGGSNALESDSQQGVDAALKLLALAYFIYKLYPGSPVERVQLFHTTPGGQALSVYFATIEVALPFADNALAAGGNLMSGLWQRFGGDAASKMGTFVGAEGAGQAQGIMGSLLAPIEGVVSRVQPYARQAADAASRFLPSAMNIADKVAGVVATGADALPVYKYLGARAAAEACVLIASRGG